jgi:hypothetical protein
MVLSVIAAIDCWPSWNPDVKSVRVEGPIASPRKGIPSILSRLRAEAERRAATP